MLHRNHCRVVITDDCNLSCDFCCMNDLETYKSFETVRALYIAKKRYDEVCITGGEPLLVLPRVIQFAALVRYFNSEVKIYLYTNGELLTRDVAKILVAAGIDGISISLHELPNWRILPEYWHLHINIIPLRFLVGEHEITDDIEGLVRVSKIPMRIWKMDDCFDMPEEDRYRIDWNII